MTHYYIIVSLAIAACGLGSPIVVSSHNARIINGTTTTIEAFPWQFSHRVYGNHICGGSILTTTRGLLLATCFKTDILAHYSALAGTANRTDEVNGFITEYSRLITHQGFSNGQFRDNIAVVWFKNELPFSSKIRPIRIPPQGAPDPIPAIGLLSGWGQTKKRDYETQSQILRFVRLPVLTTQQCKQAYGTILGSEMLCAGNLQGGRGGCVGDGGGAFVVNGVQFGIYSWSRGCGEYGSPSVFTRVSNYTHWIQEAI